MATTALLAFLVISFTVVSVNTKHDIRNTQIGSTEFREIEPLPCFATLNRLNFLKKTIASLSVADSLNPDKRSNPESSFAFLGSCILELRGGGGRSNINRLAKRKPKGVDRMRKSRRIHGLIRPHDSKHDAERRHKRYLQERSQLNETFEEEMDQNLSGEEKEHRIKRARPLRLGERTLKQVMDKIHEFKHKNPEVFEEEHRIMIDNEAYLMVRNPPHAHASARWVRLTTSITPTPRRLSERRDSAVTRACGRRWSSGKTRRGSRTTRTGRRRGRGSTTRRRGCSGHSPTTTWATATTPATPCLARTPARRSGTGGRRRSWGTRRRRAAWATAS
jgi:hypothetical protein